MQEVMRQLDTYPTR